MTFLKIVSQTIAHLSILAGGLAVMFVLFLMFVVLMSPFLGIIFF